MRHETSSTIRDWAEEALGPTSPMALVERAARELDALAECLASADPDTIAAEAADVAILLHRIASIHGRDLAASVDVKMSRNRAGIEPSRGDGTGRHVATPADVALSTPLLAASEADAELGHVLFTAEQIATRITELAAAIERDMEGEIVVVGVLKGASFFTADLARNLNGSALLAYVGVSTYGMQGSARGEPILRFDVDIPLGGRNVLIVEDLVDTGGTLSHLVDSMRARGASEIRTAVLLDLVSSRHRRRIKPDYVGFETNAKWVSGYGIDYRERFRNLPDIHEVILPPRRP